MKRVELLAPAGNMDALKAAVNAGCDAVYLGLKSFSARAFAGNFSHEEFIEAIQYCHTRDVKIYCTINTMLFESEIENAKKEVDFLYENDCDAILIQDLGLFHYVRTCYPDMPVHCSTQMHIHNLKGVEMMQKEGVERVVLARETPIEIIREACKKDVEIEVFTYGAICISYSGECMMSSATKNRSANRGMCAQCCRLKYFQEDGRPFQNGDYVLSPKDLNIIDRLPELLDAGVASLKIEGRMKRAEYVWLVTRTFREAIDAYYAHKPYRISAERFEQLAFMFHRGFSFGHIFHTKVEERMSTYRPNHQGLEIGKVMDYKDGFVQVKLTHPLYQHDGLRIINTPHDTGLSAMKILKNGKACQKANAGDIVWISCPAEPRPKKGQSLHKTTDTQLISWINAQIHDAPKTIPVKITYDARVNHPFTVTIEDTRGNIASYSSDVLCQKAKNAPMDEQRIAKSLRKSGEYPYVATSISGVLEDIFMPVSLINETRRQAMELLNQARIPNRTNTGKQPYTCHLHQTSSNLAHIIIESDCVDASNDIQVYDSTNCLPVVNENNIVSQNIDASILSSVCDLNNTIHDCIAGMTMNIANSYALAYVLSKGVDGVIFSSEMDNTQIQITLKAFEKRYGFVPKTYRLVYGRRVAMYIKDSFTKDKTLQEITDLNENHYPIQYSNGVTEILEPSYYAAQNPYCYGSYLIIRKEAEKQAIEESYEEISRRI